MVLGWPGTWPPSGYRWWRSTGRIARRADVTKQIKALVVTAGDSLREQLRELADRRLIEICAAARPDTSAAGAPTTAARIALRALARRHQRLTAEINELDEMIDPLVRRSTPNSSRSTASAPMSLGNY